MRAMSKNTEKCIVSIVALLIVIYAFYTGIEYGVDAGTRTGIQRVYREAAAIGFMEYNQDTGQLQWIANDRCKP